MDKLYYNYTFSVGFNDKDSKIQELSTEEIKEKIENLTRDILGFWTISDLNRWVRTYENGEKWVELSVNINRKSEDRALDLVNKFTKAIKKELNQESVLVSMTRERVNFA